MNPAQPDQSLPTARSLALTLRTIHSYLGMLIAPLTLFLAATGLIQVYGLHEAHAGYTPWPWVEKLGKVHKDQSYELGRHRPAPTPSVQSAGQSGPAADVARESKASEHEHADDDHDHDHGTGAGTNGSAEQRRPTQIATTLLKLYFALVAVSLFTSTLIGIWIALRNPQRRNSYASLLVIGVVLPAVLIVATS